MLGAPFFDSSRRRLPDRSPNSSSSLFTSSSTGFPWSVNHWVGFFGMGYCPGSAANLMLCGSFLGAAVVETEFGPVSLVFFLWIVPLDRVSPLLHQFVACAAEHVPSSCCGSFPHCLWSALAPLVLRCDPRFMFPFFRAGRLERHLRQDFVLLPFIVSSAVQPLSVNVRLFLPRGPVLLFLPPPPSRLC